MLEACFVEMLFSPRERSTFWRSSGLTQTPVLEVLGPSPALGAEATTAAAGMRHCLAVTPCELCKLCALRTAHDSDGVLVDISHLN